MASEVRCAGLDDPTLRRCELAHGHADPHQNGDPMVDGMSWWDAACSPEVLGESRNLAIAELGAALTTMGAAFEATRARLERLREDVRQYVNAPHCQYCDPECEEISLAGDGTPWCLQCESEAGTVPNPTLTEALEASNG